MRDYYEGTGIEYETRDQRLARIMRQIAQQHEEAPKQLAGDYRDAEWVGDGSDE